MLRAALGAGVVALLLVPTVSATVTSAPPLALLPLPKNAMGAPARGLSLARDSGVVTNADAANRSDTGVTAARLKQLGRVTGYLLDYGSPFRGGSGVHEIQTEVDVYRSAADATKALAFWRKDATSTAMLAKMGMSASSRKAGVPAVGSGRWAFVQTLRVPGLAPLHAYTAEVLERNYLLDVSVSASSTSAGARVGSGIVRKLDARFWAGEHGHLAGKPVPLPAPLKPGPPPNGPAPRGMVLKPTDVSGKTQHHGGYVSPKNTLDANALSVYDYEVLSDGQVSFVSQEVTRADGTTEAKYFSAIAAGAVAAVTLYSPKASATSVDVSSVGDNARGVLIKVPVGGGHTAYEEAVVLCRGAYVDFSLGASQTPLKGSDVHAFAATAAKRFNAGF